MKRVVITWMLIILSISFCEAQSIQDAVRAERERQEQQQRAAQEQKQREEQQRREAERQKREAEERRLFELEQRYQNTIKSAESNFKQGQYAKAKQEYIIALDLKPEEAISINPKIAEIDEFLLEQERAERDIRYYSKIASAQRNFDLRQFDQAEQDYKEALDLKPENAASILEKIAEIDKMRNEPALLHLYRKRNVLDIFPKRCDIILDNVVVGSSTNNWKTTVTVETFGTKMLTTEINGKKAEVRINFQPGGEYYVRCEVDSKSVDTGRTRTSTDRNGRTTTTKVTEIQYTPILQLVEKNLGEREFNAIK